MISALKRLLATPRAPLLCALLAALLLAPTLGAGFMMDDYVHRVMFLPEMRMAAARGPWDMFRFVDKDPTFLAYAMDRGGWPWWAAPDIRLAFFRPISSLWHVVDYRLFPDSPGLMRAESVALFALMVVLAGALYRRLLGPTLVAGLAALMFAVDDAHNMAVTWIANRHALISGALGLAALLLHDRWRRDGWRPGAALAPLAFTAALLGGESTLATAAYLFAHALWFERGLAARARALAPYLAVGVVWAVAYRALGYGATGGGFYIDPVGEPLAYLRALVERLPVLLLAQLGAPPADFWMLLTPEQRPAFIAAAAAAVALLGALLALGIPRDRKSGFFATGMVLSLLPVCATWPADRLLLLPGLGAFGLVAQLLTASREHLRNPARALVRGAAALFLLLHVILAPLLLSARGLQVANAFHHFISDAAASLPPVDAVANRTIVLVNAPDPLVINYAVAARHVAGAPVPRATRQLCIAVHGSARAARPDERTLELTLGAGFFHEPFSDVFRRSERRPSVGERVSVRGMTVEILELTPDGERPQRVAFRFDRALEDPELVWLTWSGRGFVPFTPPPVGGAADVPVTSYMEVVQGG